MENKTIAMNNKVKFNFSYEAYETMRDSDIMYWEVENELIEKLNKGKIVFDKLFQPIGDILEYHAFKLIDDTIVFNISEQ